MVGAAPFRCAFRRYRRSRGRWRRPRPGGGAPGSGQSAGPEGDRSRRERREPSTLRRDGARVPERARPRRVDADRPARPDLRRRARDDPREARVPEPRRLGEGPDRARDDRGGRARRAAQAGRDDRRADLGQHRRRARDRGGAQGLPLHLRHARQDVEREDRDAARLRRRGRDHADRRRARLARVLLLGLVAPRRGDPRRLQARPVLEHGEPEAHYETTAPGDLGADRRRDRRARDLGRHGRHDQRRRALLQGAQTRRC